MRGAASHLSSELGFSKDHRELNIPRIGFVASEIAKNGGIAICDSMRKGSKSNGWARGRPCAEPRGHAALHWRAARPQRLYAKARAGLIKQFPGISDPCEIPTDADVVIDTTEIAADEAAEKVFCVSRARRVCFARAKFGVAVAQVSTEKCSRNG